MPCPIIDSPKTSVFQESSTANLQLDVINSTNIYIEESRAMSVKDRTIVVLDWDDTLCPSSWLNDQDLLPKYKGQSIEIPIVVKKNLDRLARKVILLLEKTASYGPVFIITAAERGWVEMSASLYLPRLARYLDQQDIHIVSARTWYTNKFGEEDNVSKWKSEIVQVIATECFTATASIDPNDGFFNLISIGDSVYERDACFAAAESTPFTLAKSVKFFERSQLKQLKLQIALTCRIFDDLCMSDLSMDLHLSPEHIRYK